MYNIGDLYKIIEDIDNKKLKWEDVPYEFLMFIIQKTYALYGDIGESIVKSYGNQIIEMVEHRNRDGIILLLINFAYHMNLLEQVGQQFAENGIKIRKLFVELAYYKNYEYNENLIRKNNILSMASYCPFKGKGVVYSAIIGNYDEVKKPEFVNPNLDYILFTDNPNIRSNIWKIRLIHNNDLDNIRLARRIKILAHEYVGEYDYSIWVDGKIKIVGDLEEFIMKERQHLPMLCFNHYFNDCIYDEFFTCSSLKKDSEIVMQKQIEKYKKEGFPSHLGLTESAVIVREHNNNKIRMCMKKWWSEVLYGSYRDQLSFKYACWKTNTLYDTTKLVVVHNKYMYMEEHLIKA